MEKCPGDELDPNGRLLSLSACETAAFRFDLCDSWGIRRDRTRKGVGFGVGTQIQCERERERERVVEGTKSYAVGSWGSGNVFVCVLKRERERVSEREVMGRSGRCGAAIGRRITYWDIR
jgi:hypothetical protein